MQTVAGVDVKWAVDKEGSLEALYNHVWARPGLASGAELAKALDRRPGPWLGPALTYMRHYQLTRPTATLADFLQHYNDTHS